MSALYISWLVPGALVVAVAFGIALVAIAGKRTLSPRLAPALHFAHVLCSLSPTMWLAGFGLTVECRTMKAEVARSSSPFPRASQRLTSRRDGSLGPAHLDLSGGSAPPG